MIPIQDTPEQRRRRFPAITLLLIASNVVVFVYELSLGPTLPVFVRAFGIVPAELTAAPTLAWPPSPVPAYLTLFTSMFVHANLLHVGGNLLFLWIFGDNVEDSLGHPRFTAFYFLCGLAASGAQILSDPSSPTPNIGASGAMAGVLGGYLLLFPGSTVRTLLLVGPFVTITRVSAFLMIAVWIGLQLLSGLVALGLSDTGSQVAFWAHIGGFAAGLVTIAVWRRDRGFEL